MRLPAILLLLLAGHRRRGEQGVLIAGSNKVALMLGEALMDNGIKVQVADARREGLQEARMKKMSTFYGNPLSEHAERYMDLTEGLKTNSLFARDITWSKLASLQGQGAAIRSTHLTEEFDFEAFTTAQNKNSVNLFALDSKKKLHAFSARHELSPGPGWTVINLTTDKIKT